MSEFPNNRPNGYSTIISEYGWDETSEAWSSEAEFADAGGGRNKTIFVAIAHGKIYFEGY